MGQRTGGAVTLQQLVDAGQGLGERDTVTVGHGRSGALVTTPELGRGR